MFEQENLSVDSYDDKLYVEIIPAVAWRDEYACIKATEDGLDDEVHIHADLDRLRLALGIETTGMEDTVYDMPSPEADALDRIADALHDFGTRGDAIKFEIGRSPSDHYTTARSSLLRDTVRTLDIIGSILRDTGRL